MLWARLRTFVYLASSVLLAGAAFSALAETPSPSSSAQTELNRSHPAHQAGQQALTKPKSKKIGIVIFPGFETLDVFGPVQMWGRLPDYEIVMISEHGGPVSSSQGVSSLSNYSFETAPQVDILMIPGGRGTRTEVNNANLLAFLRQQNQRTEWTTSVCTGSAILARAGILKNRKATSNKLAYSFATRQDPEVLWQGRARWVTDGKFMTSSGVSAGTDMALSLVEKLYGRPAAEKIARGAEYHWNDDPNNDAFAVETSKR